MRRRYLLAMAQIISFTVGDLGAPANDASTYYNPAIAGKKVKLFREGIFQFGTGVNYKLLLSGTIVFIPKLAQPERITIIIN